MTIEVLRTKVTLPRRRRDLIRRERLNDLLDDLLDYKLVLLTAPAGYGKTSLLIDVAHNHELPFCWYSLDTLDQDLRRFVAYFLAAIDQRFPEFRGTGDAVLQAATQGGFSPEQLARLCADEIYRTIREHFVLVIDDFHLIDSSREVSEFINRFIQDVDENCHLVMLSRSLIALDDLPLMVARSQVGGLGFQELSFLPVDIQALMLQNYNQVIPSSMAEEMASESEGWITGLLLSSQTKSQGMEDRVRTARVSGIGLDDYFLDQVLNQQPAKMREILLHTSIFDEFNSELCEIVLEVPASGASWQETIDKILYNNLFVLPIDEGTTSLRYHHLFRDFLQNQLKIEQPEKQIELSRKLAHAYAKRQDWERAHDVYQRLEDVEAIADLLESAGEAMVKSGLVARLAEWLDSLPLVVLMSRPALLARRGFTAAALGETQRGLSLLNQAVSTFRSAHGQRQLATTLVWRAWVYFNQSDFSTSLVDADEVLNLAEQITGISGLRAEALRIRGLNLRAMGDLEKAITSLTEGLELYRELADTPSIARVSLALGATYLDTGEFGSALAFYNSACNYFREENDSYSLPVALNDLAFLHHLCGDYQNASLFYEEGLILARKFNNIRAEMFILSGLGDLFMDLDAFQAAQEVYHNAREIAHRLNHQYMVLYIYLAEAALERIKGELAQSRQILEIAESLHDSIESQYTEALFHLESGRLAMAEKDLTQATISLQKSARLFDSGGQRLDASRAYLAIANANFELGDMEAAVTDLGEAFLLVSGMESQHILVPAARQTKALLEGIQGASEITVQIKRLLEQVNQFERDIPTFRRFLRYKSTALKLAPPRLRIQALGKARIHLEKKQITSADWQTRVTRDLFYLILTDSQGWTKESIGEILWPDSTPAQLKLRFKNTIYRLRRALGPETIIFEGETYTFNRDLDYKYDVEDFWEALERAKRSVDDQERKTALREAVRVYKGDYLPEMGGTWATTEREYLHRAYIEANLELAELHMEAGENDLSLSICSDLITEEPRLEEAHCLAMRIHAAIGNRTAVIEQYDLLKQALNQEFDASPSSDTQLLYQSLTR
jgi:ATP/maltotriose-dependent transcriptional regulator MalT